MFVTFFLRIRSSSPCLPFTVNAISALHSDNDRQFVSEVECHPTTSSCVPFASDQGVAGGVATEACDAAARCAGVRAAWRRQRCAQLCEKVSYWRYHPHLCAEFCQGHHSSAKGLCRWSLIMMPLLIWLWCCVLHILVKSARYNDAFNSFM